MKLTRLRIEQLRRFQASYELDGLAPGLNIFTGPNGVGKSTIVRAIRASFLERHRSTAVEDLRPSGDSSAVPTIEIGFQLDGKECLLQKSFFGRKRCLLRIGSQQLDGEAAEQKLAEIVGFELPGRGASKQEHWGIPGLLWIEQGSGHEVDQAVSSAADYLRGALDQSLGEVASSNGDELQEQIQALRSELLTGTGKPRGRFDVAKKEHERLVGELQELDKQVDAYRQQVDRLTMLRAEHGNDTAERPWDQIDEREREATVKLQAIHERARHLEIERQRREQVARQLQLVTQQLEEFARQSAQLKERERAVRTAQEQLGQVKAEVSILAARQVSAESDYQTAGNALPLARREERRHQLQVQLDSVRERLTSLRAAIVRAEHEQRKVVELRRPARLQPISKAQLEKLRRQAQDKRELTIRAEAVATRLRYTLSPGRELRLGDEVMCGDGEQLLLAPAILKMPGIGTLEITPGGDSVADIARRRDEIDEAHQALLLELGFPTLAAAENRFIELEQLQQTLRQAEQALEIYAPQGLEELAIQEEERKTSVASLEATLDELAPSDPNAPSLAMAEQARDDARVVLDTLAIEFGHVQKRLGSHQTAAESARRELANLAVRLQDANRQQRERDLQAQLLEQQALLQALDGQIEAHQRAIADARPELLEQDIRRLRASADNLRRAHSQRETEIARLQGQLEQTGSLGLEERRAELAAQVSYAERRHGELALRARALDLLSQLLQEKRRELTRRLQAPLQRHLNHYLRLLFPDATVEINEDLTLGRVTRSSGGSTEIATLAQQSFGTREQVALIGRLAYADLLREAGRPTHIILDDCLVHSDRHRLAEMKRVLFDAAQRHQILMFTCHPEAWRDMGVEQRAIGP